MIACSIVQIELGGVLEAVLSDMKGVTGVVNMASMYSSTGLKIWQSHSNNDTGLIHYPLDHQILITTCTAPNMIRSKYLKSWQNKNNSVLRLVPLLVDTGYFKADNFVSLVVGHTKNLADCFLMCWKLWIERKIQIFEDDQFLKQIYSNFTGKIKQNHIFSMNENRCDSTRQEIKNTFFMAFKVCDHPKANIQMHNCIIIGLKRDQNLQRRSKVNKAFMVNNTSFIKKL